MLVAVLPIYVGFVDQRLAVFLPVPLWDVDSQTLCVIGQNQETC